MVYYTPVKKLIWHRSNEDGMIIQSLAQFFMSTYGEKMIWHYENNDGKIIEKLWEHEYCITDSDATFTETETESSTKSTSTSVDKLQNIVDTILEDNEFEII